MIEDIELARSGKAKCQGCGCKIGKGTPRRVEFTSQRYGHSQTYYCYKCVPLSIEKTIKYQKNIKKNFNKLIKKQTKEIIVMELEDKGGDENA